MSLLIKGMKMPQSCIACQLNFGEKRPEYGLTICCPYSDGVISWRDKAFDNGRLASCGIIQVQPHGRLKDYDRIMEQYSKWFRNTENSEYENMFYMLHNELRDAPTIIPAEEG